MRRLATFLVFCLASLSRESDVFACGPCSLDSSKPGQTLMLITMICLPFVIAGIGIGAIRRLVSEKDSE